MFDGMLISMIPWDGVSMNALSNSHALSLITKSLFVEKALVVPSQSTLRRRIIVQTTAEQEVSCIFSYCSFIDVSFNDSTQLLKSYLEAAVNPIYLTLDAWSDSAKDF